MAIASIVCGVIGLFGSIYSVKNLLMIHKFNIHEYSIFGVISFVIILMALILGIIELKKSKNQIYYRMAIAGFVMSVIGTIVQVLPIIYIYFTNPIITYDSSNKSIKFWPTTYGGIPRGSYCMICNRYYCGSYVGTSPIFSYFSDIGTITTKTKDINPNYTVTIKIILGYAVGDEITEAELNTKQYEINDFLEKYFSDRYASELMPENEERFKRDIMETLNIRLLSNAKIRYILIDKLDVMEVFE